MMNADGRLNRRTFLQIASGSAAALMADSGRGANPQSDSPRIRNPTRSQLPLDQHGGHQSRSGLLRRQVRRDAEHRPAGRAGRAVRQRLLPFGRLCADAVGDHHRDVPDDDRHAPHALPGRAAGRGQVLPGVPAGGRLLLHEQRQDRLPVRSAADGVGRVQQQGALAQPPEGPALLRGLQHHDDAREPDPQPQPRDDEAAEQPGPGRAARPRQGQLAAVLPGYAQGPAGLGPVLRPDHAHGQAGAGPAGPA